MRKYGRTKLNNSQTNFGEYFFGGKPVFFRAINLSVNTRTDICSLICECNYKKVRQNKVYNAQRKLPSYLFMRIMNETLH